MDINSAVKAVSALGHAHRMKVFRILIREGPSGLPAGAIGSRLGVSPSALSFHLAHLERAGLVRSWREGRNLMYSVEIDGMRELLTFLTEDCCDGHPEICGILRVSCRPCRPDGARAPTSGEKARR
jgi:ArsR family transcriptional regulator